MGLMIDATKLAAACVPVSKILSTFPTKYARFKSTTLREIVTDVTSLEDLVEEIEPGEPWTAFALMLLAKRTITTKPSPLGIVAKSRGTLRAVKKIGDVRVHHGDLNVEGPLVIDADLMITGNLKVSGVVQFASEYACLYIAGDVEAQALHAWGKGAVIVGGSLRAKHVVAVTEASVEVGKCIETKLVLVSSIGGWIGVHDKKKVGHWFSQEDLFDRPTPSLAKLRTLLVPELFSAKDEDDDTNTFVYRLFERIPTKKPIWNVAAPKTKAAPKKKRAPTESSLKRSARSL